MSRRFLFLLAAVVSLPTLVVAQPAGRHDSGAWSGTIVYSSCNADEAFNESPECFRAAPGAKLSLYDDTNRVMYSLAPQEPAAAHWGDSVTGRGPLDGKPIHVAPLDLRPTGLA